MSLFTRSTDPTPPMPSDTRRQRLAELEQVIAARLQHWIAAGQALAEIRDQQLYRLTHKTFAEYVEQRWGITARRAYQLMVGTRAAAEATDSAPATPAAIIAERVDALPAEQKSEVKATLHGNATRKTKRRRKPKAIRLQVPGAIVIIERREGTTDPAKHLADALTKLAAANAEQQAA